MFYCLPAWLRLALLRIQNSWTAMADLSVKSFINFFSVILFCSIIQRSAADCKGCVELDSYSFYKIISKFKAVTVKFDVAYPFGDKHEEYEKVSEASFNINDLLVSLVGVKDYGEKDNLDLSQKYGITKEDFPVVLLFVQGKKDPIKFTDEFKAENILKFIREKSGVYIGLPGCLEDFDKLAIQFAKETSLEKRKQLLRKMEDLWDKVKGNSDQKSAEMYVKTSRKIIEKGNDFTEAELKRIQNILKGKISKEKTAEIHHRINILQSFMTVVKDEL